MCLTASLLAIGGFVKLLVFHKIPCFFHDYSVFSNSMITRLVAQSVTCLATDARLTAYPGVASLIPARSHTFVEIDHEIISTVILLPSADSFKKGCCQLQVKVCAQINKLTAFSSLPRKKCG